MHRSHQPRIAGALALCALFFSSIANTEAAFITSVNDLQGPAKVVDFDQFGDPFVNTGGPVQIGGSIGEDITFEATDQNFNPGGGLIGTGYTDLSTNGSWNSDRGGYTALANRVGTMVYRFHDGPVSGVAAFLNYDPTEDDYLSVVEILGAGDSVLETVILPDVAPIDTSGSNKGAYRGFQRDQADIYAFRVHNQILVLDDLTFVRPDSPVIPEPSSILLAGFGLASLAAVSVRRRRRATSA